MKSALLSSSVIVKSAEFDARAGQGGSVTDLPHVNPYGWTEANVASDDPSVKSTAENLDTGKQIVFKDYRSKDWGAMDLVSAVSGVDIMGEVGNIVATYWAQEYQALALAKLKGIELDNAANDGGDMIVNLANDTNTAITAAQSANFASILDAKQTMGDAMGTLSVIVMHSQIFTNLMKLEPTAFVAPSTVNPFTTYNGSRVIVDDTTPVVTGTYKKTYTTYLLAPGAFSYGEANLDNAVAVSRGEDEGNGFGSERLFSRKQLILHPNGFACAAAITARRKSPTNAQYGVAAAFDRVFARKNVNIAILKTNA
ncbi:MAG: major capsid protein [Sphingobium sp.]